VQAHHFLAPCIRRAHHVEHFLQGHVRAVVDDAGFLALGEQLGVHKAPRPNDHVGRAQKARPAQRDKVGGARACANDMNHPSLPFPFLIATVYAAIRAADKTRRLRRQSAQIRRQEAQCRPPWL